MNRPDIITFVTSPKFLGDRTVSIPQRAILKAVYGLAMDEEEAAAWKVLAEGRKARAGGYDEATLICGVGSGKSEKLAANIAAYEAVTFPLDAPGHPSPLSPGEFAYVVIVAQNKKQAGIVRSFIEGKLYTLEDKGIRVLYQPRHGHEKAVTGDEIRLRNRVIIACMPCNKASFRGFGLIVFIGDEPAYWRTEELSYNVDAEVFRAARSRFRTTARWGVRHKLVKITSPFMEAGEVFEDWKNRERLRKVCVVKAPSKFMNPTIDDEWLRAYQERDPDGYRRDCLAEFGGATSGSYIPAEYVDRCTDTGRTENPPRAGMDYRSAMDAAFKRDMFVHGIAHLEGGRCIHDSVRFWVPRPGRSLDPKDVLPEVIDRCRRYGVDRVIGDQFADELIKSMLQDGGIRFELRATTETTNFEMYKNLRAVMGAGLTRIPDDATIRRDLLGLVKRPGASRTVQTVGAPNLKGHYDDIPTVIALLTMELLPIGQRLDIAAMNAQGAPGRTGTADFTTAEERSENWERNIMDAVL